MTGRDKNSTGRAGRNEGRREPTIRDVASAAGVSISTVSKALNKSGSLKDETRERIIAVAEELGFRPNLLAQSLHSRQSFTVGLISNDSFGRFTMPIAEGLEACLADASMSVFICNATDDPAREREHLEHLLGKRVDGIVITARRADRRPALDRIVGDLPVIYVFSQSDDPNSACLLPDDEGGARLAVDHLIAQGRKRIAHVTGPESFMAVGLRHQGYLKSLEQAGLPAYDHLYLSGVWSEKWGYCAARKLFAENAAKPDAIFCGNDPIARGAADAFREMGVSVPDDVALVGFDNWEVMAEASRPPLTSVDLNLYDLGAEAGRQLIAMIGGEEIHGVQRLPCRLVIRESSGASGADKSEKNRQETGRHA